MCVRAFQGAALGAMVGQMTYGKRQFDSLDSIMRRLIPPFHQAMNELLVMVDADSKAFSRYMVRGKHIMEAFGRGLPGKGKQELYREKLD